jgi:hypothetical protein
VHPRASAVEKQKFAACRGTIDKSPDCVCSEDFSPPLDFKRTKVRTIEPILSRSFERASYHLPSIPLRSNQPKLKNMKSGSEKKAISPWDYKPWWCQPWSILLTGTSLISGSWFLLKTVWITVLVAIPLLAWMGFFLLVWPRLMVSSGALDSHSD